jgi:hypothetical protein
VGHGVVVNEVLPQALDEAIRIAAGETDAVVGSGVVYQPIQPAILLLHILDGPPALRGIFEMRLDEVAGLFLALHLFDKVFDVLRDTADDDNLCALVQAGAGYGFSNARGAAGHYDDVTFQSQIHIVPLSFSAG